MNIHKEDLFMRKAIFQGVRDANVPLADPFASPRCGLRERGGDDEQAV